MRKRDLNVPTNLRNGAALPKRFEEILKQVPQPPKYKIVVYGIDAFSTHWRLVHAYYISLLSDDPSRVQSWMKERSKAPKDGFEDGKLIENMMVYREHMYLKEMPSFGGRLNQIVEENSKCYVMVRFHNIVQYSRDKFDDPIVMSSISFT